MSQLSSVFFTGSLAGLAIGIAVWFSVSSTYDTGLVDFVKNTSEPIVILSGGVSCFLASSIITVIISLCTHNIKTSEDAKYEFEKLRNIDNPLTPWTEIYQEDFPELTKNDQPSKEQLDQYFRKAKLISYIGGSIVVLLLVIIAPVTMSLLHVMSFEEFSTWTLTVHIFGLIMAFLVVFPTPIEETYLIYQRMRKNKKQQYIDLKQLNELKI